MAKDSKIGTSTVKKSKSLIKDTAPCKKSKSVSMEYGEDDMSMSKGSPKKGPKHIGFKGAEKKVESEGCSKKAAGAIVANASRKASPAEKKANPKLKKVKG